MRRLYDLAGAATVTGGLVVIVFAIVKAQSFGWCSGGRSAGLLLRSPPLAAFVAIESRSRGAADVAVRSSRSVVGGGDTVLLLVGSATFGMFYFASLYVQEVLVLQPAEGGAGLPAGDRPAS